MPSSLNGTGITFSDSSTQSTAATAAALVTTTNVMNASAGQTYNGVGTLRTAMTSSSSRITNGSTLSGSYLFNTVSWASGQAMDGIGQGNVAIVGNRINATSSFSYNPGGGTMTQNPIGSGTWRNLGNTVGPCTFDGCNNLSNMPPSLWIRTA